MNRVAIIGSGLSGLSCAFTLRKANIDAVVFDDAEAGGRAGGGPYLLNPEMFRETFRLVREIGLGAEILPIRPVAGQYYRGRVYHHRVASATGLLKFRGLHLADKALLGKMAYLLGKYAAQLDFHHPERGIGLDDETVAAFVKRELSQNILNYVAGPLISTLFFYSSEETSRLLYLNLARFMHDTQMHTIRGGLSRISERLSRDCEIRPERVAGISMDNAKYRIRDELFRSVVVAIPGDRVLQIDGMRKLLVDEDSRFFETCRYQRAVRVGVVTPKPVDGVCYGLSIPRVERLHAAAIAFEDVIDPETVPAGAGRLSITGGGPSVSADHLMGDLKKIYGIDAAAAGTAREWKSAMPMFPPGRFRDLAAFLGRKRRPGLEFCGDYLMGPFVEGAVATGLRAAESIIIHSAS